MSKKLLYKNVEIELLGHDSVRVLANDSYVYIDPYQLDTTQMMPKADIILISHAHADHCSPEDIALISTPETIIISVPDTLSKLTSQRVKDVKLVRPGDKVDFGTIHIQAVSAYNVNKFRSPGMPFHPQENEWLGYLIDVDGTIIYFAGDTDEIPEMSTFGNIDIAFLPVSGTYVMTVEEAVNAAFVLKPSIAVPMHYGAIVGTSADAEKFKTLLEGKIRVEILQ